MSLFARYVVRSVPFATLTCTAVVRGVDLFPPSILWVPPNCTLEVDDILKDWTWNQKFDLVHMRFMGGSFNEDEWESLYAKIFE